MECWRLQLSLHAIQNRFYRAARSLLMWHKEKKRIYIIKVIHLFYYYIFIFFFFYSENKVQLYTWIYKKLKRLLYSLFLCEEHHEWLQGQRWVSSTLQSGTCLSHQGSACWVCGKWPWSCAPWWTMCASALLQQPRHGACGLWSDSEPTMEE